MKVYIPMTTNFIPSDGGSSLEGPHHKHYAFQTDLALFHVCTNRPLAEYLYFKLKDCGLTFECKPFFLNLDLVIENTWTACVVNPDNNKVLYSINSPERFTVQTLCAMLSVQFQRHEIRLTKFKQVRMVYHNGVIVKDSLEFNSSHQQPKDWI